MYVAIVTGANGQDGLYMCELLLNKGYEIKRLTRSDGDVLDYLTVYNIVSECSDYERIEIYNLAAKVNSGTPTETFKVNTIGLQNILEAVRELNIQDKCRICQASSSEMFGNTKEVPQNEVTQFYPRSIYGVSKVAAHWLTRNYRENYGIYACSAILYNHESPKRDKSYVTQKIVKGLQSGECFHIGNLESRRDWGHVEDYVEAMWLMLQQDTPDDYIVATGTTYSVREFIEITTSKLGKTINWSGEGVEEVGSIDDKVIVRVSKDFYRPCESNLLAGDSSKIRNIGWIRKHTIHTIIDDMLNSIS